MPEGSRAVLAALIAAFSWGCVGAHTWTPEGVTLDSSLSRSDVIERYGDPDRSEEDASIFVYTTSTHRWCGVVLYAVVLPIPLMAPVCDTEHRFVFEGDRVEKEIYGSIERGGVSCGPLPYFFSAMMDFGQNNQSWCN